MEYCCQGNSGYQHNHYRTQHNPDPHVHITFTHKTIIQVIIVAVQHEIYVYYSKSGSFGEPIGNKYC
jgi:hypothetical protein